MASRCSLGIDLGTSRSGIARASVEKTPFEVRALPLGKVADGRPSYRMPSVLSVNHGMGRYLVGEDAGRVDGSKGFKTFASAKSDLTGNRIYFGGLGSIFVKPSNVLAEIIMELQSRAAPALGIDARTLPTTIAVPASLPYDGRKEILDAARKAGLPVREGDLVEEPVAVLLDSIFGPAGILPKNPTGPMRVAVYDIGAGTCDVAVFELDMTHRNGTGQDFRIKPLAIGDYDRLGGDNFDIEIARKALMPQVMGERGLSPEEARLFIKQNRLVAKCLKEELCRAIETVLLRDNRQCAKVPPMEYPALKVTGRTNEVPGTDLIIPAKDVTLTTEMMLLALRPFLSPDADEGEIEEGRWVGSLLGPLEFALIQSDIDPETELDFLILSGACCRAPFVPYVISAYCAQIGIPPGKIRHADLDLSVERGAAIHAGVLALTGHPPIAPVLGEDIGLWVYGNRPELIVEAGRILPYPPTGEQVFADAFFVPEDNLDRLVVELYARSRKSRKRIIRKSFDIPQHTPAGAPVTVSLRIDASKMIHLKAALVDYPDVGLTIHGEDVRISGRAPDEEEWVKSARENIHKAVETTGTAPLNELLNLAHGESLRHNETSWRKSHEILDHVIENHPREARAWNILGLLRWTENDLSGAERGFRKAISIDAHTRSYRTNLGYVLLEMGRSADAVHVLAAAHTRWPDYPYAGEIYARALEAEGKYQDAVTARQKTIVAYSTSSKSPLLYAGEISWLVRLYEGIGERAKADEILKQKDHASTPPDVTGPPYKEALLAGPDSPQRSLASAS